MRVLRILVAVGLMLGIGACHQLPSKPELGTYEFVMAWGDSGSGDGQFAYPRSVAVDAMGNVLVADPRGQRVQKFSNEGSFIAQWGDSGSADGEFAYPWSLATDADGHVYVTDSGNHRIQKFTSNGVFLAQWSAGVGPGRRLGGIAVSGPGIVYVADVSWLAGDTYLHRVQAFSSDGAFLFQWEDSCDRTAPGNGGHVAWDLAVDDSGHVFATDTDNLRIRKFTAAGESVTQWGDYGYGNGQFRSPEGIAVGSDGSVSVVDLYGGRIQKFSGNGAYLTQWGHSGDGESGFTAPRGAAVDAADNVYVVDSYHRRIQKWAPRR